MSGWSDRVQQVKLTRLCLAASVIWVLSALVLHFAYTGGWWMFCFTLVLLGLACLFFGIAFHASGSRDEVGSKKRKTASALYLATIVLCVVSMIVPAIQWVVTVSSTNAAQGIAIAEVPSSPTPTTATPAPTPAPSTGQNGQAQGSSTGNRGSNPISGGSDNGTSGTGQQSSGSNGNTKQVVQPTPKAYETCYYTAYDAAKGSNNFGPRLKKETKQAAVDRAVWKIKNDCLWAATKVWMHDNKVSDPNKVDLNAVRSLAMKYDADPARWRSDVARLDKDFKSVKFVKVSKHYSTLGMKTYSDGSMPTLLKSHESAAQGWTLVTTYHNGTVLQQRTACDFQFSIPDKA